MSEHPPKLVASSASSFAKKPLPPTTTTAAPPPPQNENKKAEEKKAEPSARPVPPAVLKRRESQITKDLMISYSHADNEIMSKIREALEDNGISVWVDVSGLKAGVDFLSKIGEAIIDCKLFLSLLSKTSVKSKYCQDELALAYVSNSAIFPVTLDDTADLKPMMDTGMKLQLASYEWTELGRDSATFKENFESLLKKLKDELSSLRADTEVSKNVKTDEEKREPEPPKKSMPALQRQDTRHKLNLKSRRVKSASTTTEEALDAKTFWKDNFGSKTEIEWPKFVEAFDRVYEKQLNQMIGADDLDWLHGVLQRELEVEEHVMLLYQFSLLAFCNIDGQYQSLWSRVKEQASESFAMNQVFDMDSSVRVEAIENLGKFRSAAVIDALRDLLSDSDANVRAVATISLARTEAKDPVTVKFLMKTLNDKDRLVREAGCLALGHLQAHQAVNKILHMWRNDVISHVREAANVALSQIGGEEVEKAMRITKVLADEIRQLTST